MLYYHNSLNQIHIILCHHIAFKDVFHFSFHHSPFINHKVIAESHIVCWADRKTGTYLEPINRPRVKFRKKKKKKERYRTNVSIDKTNHVH